MLRDYRCEFIKTTEQLAQLRSFAASFDHEIASTEHPLVVLKERENWKGYAQVVTRPLVFTAWHPHASSPRDTLELGSCLKFWARFQYGQGFVPVPIDQPNQPKTLFTPEVMAKMGYKRMHLELYEG